MFCFFNLGLARTLLAGRPDLKKQASFYFCTPVHTFCCRNIHMVEFWPPGRASDHAAYAPHWLSTVSEMLNAEVGVALSV